MAMLPLTTSERKCVIKGCGNISMFKQSHQFPSMPDRCAQWLQAIGPNLDDDLIGLPIEKFKRRIVCVDHFEPSCISPQSPRFLKRTAIPTIFPVEGVEFRPHVLPPRAPLAAPPAPRTIVLPKIKPEDRQKMFFINKSLHPPPTQPTGPTLLIEPLDNTSAVTQEEIEQQLLQAATEAESGQTELPMLYVSSHYGKRGRPKPALKITKVYPNRKAPQPSAPEPPTESSVLPDYPQEWAVHGDDVQVLAVEAAEWGAAEEIVAPAHNNNVERKRRDAAAATRVLPAPPPPAPLDPPPWQHHLPEDTRVVPSETVDESERHRALHNHVAPSPRCTASSPHVPRYAPYLLLGGGAASVAAFRAIRAHDPTAKVLVVSEEYAYPYRRTMLSKATFWRSAELDDLQQLAYTKSAGSRCSLLYEPETYYTAPEELHASASGGVAVARGYAVRRVDAARRAVVLRAPGREDAVVHYGECLIATGASPKKLSILENSSPEVRERCVTLSSARDARELWRRLEAARGAVVVGAGYLGSELAGALARRVRERGADTAITHLFREAGVMWHVLPEYLARWSTRQMAANGVRVCGNTEILNAYMKDGRVTLELSNAEVVETDLIVVCVGSAANTEFAAASGLEVHPQLGGFVVTADYCVRDHLYAAGDAACPYSARWGRQRAAHASHAAASGRSCGLRMCGATPPPAHRRAPTTIRSRLGPQLYYEAVGIIDSNLEMTGAFSNLVQVEGSDKNYDQGVVFYLQANEIVGVLMWNLRGRMNIARKVLSDMQSRTGEINELADLFITSDAALRKLESERLFSSPAEKEQIWQYYQCDHCSATFGDKCDMQWHLSATHAQCHACDACGALLPSAAALAAHYAAHGVSSTPPAATASPTLRLGDDQLGFEAQ